MGWFPLSRGVLCLLAIAFASQIGGCKTSKKAPVTTMVSPVMEISGGKSSEKALTTASVTGAKSRPEVENDEDTFTLEFAKGKYSISREQNEKLSAFAAQGRQRRKNFQLTAYAQPQPPGTDSDVYAKVLLDANRRAQATGMILRMHGVSAENIAIRTEQTGAPGKREVRLLLN